MNKQKAKKRLFQDVWTEKYGCIENGDKLICTLCTNTITARTYNIERHFFSNHKDVNEMPDNEKYEYIAKRVLNYGTQNKILKRFVSTHNYATSASFVAAHSIATNGKPLTDGEYLKKEFINCSEHLFNDFANKQQIIERIKEMPLSARTVQRRIEDMSKNIDAQVKNDLLSSDVISIALDECTDVNSMTRLAIIIRFASINSSNVNEELCVFASMNKTTKGIDIFRQVQKFTNFKNGKVLDLKSKLFSITTDGAPAMRDKNVGFVELMENELCRPLLSFHCIIHEENLFAKTSTQQLKDVMEKVVKIVNIMVARSALTHRRFKAFLEEIELKYGDLLKRFVECFEDIKMFLNEIGENDPELNDKQWFSRLLFLTDITNHYNNFNIRLQENNDTILKMYEEWKSFYSKLVLFETDIKTKIFRFFPLLKSQHEKENINESNLNMFESCILNIKSEFKSRSEHFQKHGEMFTFIIKPDEIEEKFLNLQYFEHLKIDNLSFEMIDFKSSTLWTNKFQALRKDLENTEDNHLVMISSCWASLPTNFSCLKKIAFAILSVVSSTYKYEKIFSQTKFILSKNRNGLTTEHSDACIRLKATKYEPDLTKLASEIQHQGSH